MNENNKLKNRSILLIISGGIAAYKCLDLIRRLRETGASVRCVMTKGGEKFITPLSVATLSGEPVFDDLWSLTDEQQVGHIRLSRDADLVVVAPATANLMAKMANGLADDLASTVLLATNKSVMIAPAMNCMMWQHAATQANLLTLRSRGIQIITPQKGAMACGEEGEGRMAEVADILGAINSFFEVKGQLSGKRALVTSGPTFEPLDPVRFLGNRSSGKQGHAIAAALASMGAETILVTGPTTLPDPSGVKTVHIETAREMLASCEAEWPLDVAVCAAAVADWRPINASKEKLKKGIAEPVIKLEENPDILATISKSKNHRPKLVIGFAAETGNLQSLAEEKMQRKGCDWILANTVCNGKGFAVDENEIIFLRRDAPADHWPLQSKKQIAQRLAEEIARKLSE